MSVKPFGYMQRMTLARVLAGNDEGVNIVVKPTKIRDAPIYDQSAIDQLTAEIAELRSLIKDVDENAQRAWADLSLSTEAWPAALARRVTNAANAADVAPSN